MSQPKVFEYAKELGMQPLELMDKLREWKIPVRSHMAELDASAVELIQQKLSEGKSPAKTTKKAAVKKKAATAAAPAAKTTAKAATKTAAKAPAKATTKKSVAKETAEDKAAAASDSSARKIIRRRAPTEEEKAAEAARVAEEEAQAQELREQEEIASTETAEVEASQAEEVEESAAVQEVVEVEAAETVEVAPPAVVETVTPPVVEVVKEPAPAVVARPAAPRPSVKREVVMNPAEQRQSRPRGNIVGRMDLSKAGPPPGTGRYTAGGSGSQGGTGGGYRPRTGGGGPTSGPSAGPQRFSSGGSGGPGGGFGAKTGNLRTGFFSAPPPPSIFENRGGKEDRRKKSSMRSGPGAGPGTPTAPLDEGAAREEVIETFSATEFRKREIVFQPKKKNVILGRESLKTQITTPKASKRILKVTGPMTVADFAKELKIKVAQLTTHLIKNGITATPAQTLDIDTMVLTGPEFGFEVENHQRTAEELITESRKDLMDNKVSRAPIVTVMGHVDHGKTSLLDAIRKADVASGEAGGITQHIGAYRVTLEDGNQVTFIDTPGHAAFTAMRARGANATDIAVIVVAADDGVMPQTAEAINHAKAAKVPIIVAINKMDKPGVNTDRIKQQLTEFELVPEEWGGSTIYCPVSALKKTGIKELLEQIHVSAEVLELKANPEHPATGVVIESKMEKGRGVVATVLIKDGTLRAGQTIVAGSSYGRLRAMTDERRQILKEAGPSVPVEVLGLNEVPQAGDRFDVCEDETAAREIAALRKKANTAAPTTPSSKMSLEDLFAKVQAGEAKELAVILKTDVAGSNEAIRGQLEKLSTTEVKVRVIHHAVGGITESDVLLASTSKGVIIGFNVRPDSNAAAVASREGIEIKTYAIIYELIDDVRKAMEGLLAPEIIEKTLGRVEVRNVFTIPKSGTIAGCYVNDGKIVRSALARLTREGRIVYEGKISSLKRFKEDVREVQTGFECGIGIENYNDIKVGDVIEAFEKQSKAREL